MMRYFRNLWNGLVSICKGMKVTFKNLFSPAVTLQYPMEKQPMKESFRGLVDLVPEKCVICYQCVKICPTAALFLSHQQGEGTEKKREIKEFVFNIELCCYCGLCEEICPTDAMYLNQRYEVSAYSHEDLNHIDLMNPDKYKKFDQQNKDNR